ncbi:hypothetical protein KAW18_11230 [candidate division WOR-3 bacterium]|nr:hypothetical protein [candidate division WOR-3 bacterium]
MNIHPPIAYIFSILIMLFVAAGIKRSRIIDAIANRLLDNNNEKNAILLLITLSYVVSPLFLSFVLISSFDKWLLRFKNKSVSSALLVASALMGSVILPFGNMRNIYIAIYVGNGKPDLPLAGFASSMLPLWITGLLILLVSAYFLSGKEEIKEKKTPTKWRWKELIFSGILYIFIILFFNGRMSLLGFSFIAGAFTFAFISRETLKQVDWWILIPAGVAFIAFYLLKGHPFILDRWPGFLSGSIGSVILSSNIFSYILPSTNTNTTFLLYGISVGAVGGILGSAETIWIWRKARIKPNWKITLEIFGIYFIVASIILWIGGFNG